MNIKNEEKNQLHVEFCYKYHFYTNESSILEDYYCEKTFKKYLFNQKIQPEVDHRLTPKNSKNQPSKIKVFRGQTFQNNLKTTL